MSNTATSSLTQQVVRLEERAVYGRFNYYVMEPHRDAVTRLTGKRTVDANDIRALESLGFCVRVAGRPEMPASEAMH